MEAGSTYPFSGSVLGEALTLTANGISIAGLRITTPPTEEDGYTTLARESETTDSEGSPLVHHTPVLSEASGLVVDLAERWATQTSVALGHARVATSTLNIEGARSAASLVNAEALRGQMLGRTAPRESRPIMLSVTAPPIDQRGRYPIAYTMDLIAPRSTTYFPRSSTATACISTLDCGPNEVCSREECSLTSTGARTRVAWVLPAQSDTPSP